MKYDTLTFKKSQYGFTLIEVLVVIGVIGVLAAIVTLSFSKTTVKAKDMKRKAEVNQMGRLLPFGCRAPDGGVLDIDLLDYANQLAAQNPSYASFLSNVPKDPKSGSDTKSGYRYIVSTDYQKCALYANLETKEEPVTLTAIASPTPGQGTGVLQSTTTGPNGTDRYYQFSN